MTQTQFGLLPLPSPPSPSPLSPLPSPLSPPQGLPEAVGNAVAVSLQRMVQSSYEDVFKGAVLPSFERACQEMFRQIDEAFKRGTTECELGTGWREDGVVFYEFLPHV